MQPTRGKSAEKRINIEPYPAGFNQDDWLVANSPSLSDRWQGNLNNVKVGDVLVRQISRSVQGTVSELIPPIQWDSIQGVSLYKTRSTVENNKTRTVISATRHETMRILFEKEGEVTIPAMAFSWYNLVQKGLFKRTLKEITINVQPNPDLGVLASIRDSLCIAQIEAIATESSVKSGMVNVYAQGVTSAILMEFELIGPLSSLSLKSFLTDSA